MAPTIGNDPCNDLEPMAEGKTKIIYADRRDDSVVLIRAKDYSTAGDDEKHSLIAHKAVLATAITTHVYHLLNEAGLATHFLSKVDSVTFRAQRCTMIPVEVVVRRIATGSYLLRYPEVAEGTRFRPPVVELFEKNEKHHDPLLEEDDIVRRGLLTAVEVVAVKREALRAFEVLERAWAQRNVVLVDFKIEFGRGPDRTLLLADVITNDNWRIWPGGHKDAMTDLQESRVLDECTSGALAVATEYDRWVAHKTESFLNTRMGRALLFRPLQNLVHPCAEEAHLIHTLFRELHYLGIECTSVQDADVPAAVRAYNADGRPTVGFIIGPHVPWLQESVAFPIIHVESQALHDRTVEDACRRAAWQGARVLSVQDPSLYGRLLDACRG